MAELFIGRETLCNRLREDVFFVEEDSFGQCYSVIGPNGIGKTTLIRHLADEFKNNTPANTYYFSTVLEDGITFWSYWSNLFKLFIKKISEDEIQSAPDYNEDAEDEILDAYDFFKNDLSTIDDDKYLQSVAIGHLNTIFEAYTEIGIRIIITIDEFDRARTIFKTGQFFQRLFGLTKKGAANLNLSILTISRRSVSTIAHHMQEGSNFQDAFPPIPVKGFSNKELEAYFNTYAELPCGLLDEREKNQIACLCGRNPGLLMGMRHEIKLCGEEGVDVADIFKENGSFILTAYDRMVTLMNTEYVDHDKTMSSMSIFVQQFIGPVYTDNLEEKVKKLYSYGFITQKGKNEKDIFELAGMTKYRDAGKLIYEPMSPYFVEYVKVHVLPDDLHSLAGLLEKTERKIREIIAVALKKKFPDTWQDELQTFNPNKDDYLERLREVAGENDADLRQLTISKLNVLAFNDYYKIIKRHWDVLNVYFTRYSSLDELKKDMEELNTCRNTSAHLNLEILNDSGRRGIKGICEFMLASIGQVTDAAGQTDSEESVSAPVSEPLQYGYTKGQVVTMRNMSISSTGVLRGIIEGTAYGVSLSKKYLQDSGLSAHVLMSKGSITVSLKRWDDNAQKFNAEYVQ